MDKDVLRNLQNVWLNIAEQRTTINKAKERIMILIQRGKEGLDVTSGALTKAAYGITEKELEDLSNSFYSDKNLFAQELEEFITQKEQEKFTKSDDKDKQLKKLILKQVGIKVK